MRKLPVPRLLPSTIAATAALLGVKSVTLVRAALPADANAGIAVASAQTPAPPATSRNAAAPATTPVPPPPPTLPPSSEPPPVSDAERTVLLQLRKRRQQLDERETALTARESVLAAAQQKLNARVEQLTALQKKLEALEAARQQREEAGWQGLVKVYEVMKPRDAAAIFNDLEMKVLLPVLDRMKDRNAAPILAAMNPDKAREATAALARLRTSRDGPATTAQPGG